MESHVDEIKKRYHLEDPIWQDIDPYLIILAVYEVFPGPGKPHFCGARTGFIDPKDLESIGTEILKVIMAMQMTRTLTRPTHGEMAAARGGESTELKRIIGSLYWYLHCQKGLGYESLDYIHQWLYQ